MRASPRPSLPPYPEANLNFWRFDEDRWLIEPRTAPLAVVNPDYVESWSGSALRMAGPNRALVVLPERSKDDTLNLPMNQPGSIRFWFVPEWTSANAGGGGPGWPATLFEIGAWSGQDAVGWWTPQIDSIGTLIHFIARDNRGETIVLSAAISWTVGQWHQLTLAWDPEGETRLYLDGLFAAAGAGVTMDRLTSFGGTRGLSLGGDVHGERLAQGRFEEVYTFGQDFTQFQVSMQGTSG